MVPRRARVSEMLDEAHFVYGFFVLMPSDVLVGGGAGPGPAGVVTAGAFDPAGAFPLTRRAVGVAGADAAVAGGSGFDVSVVSRGAGGGSVFGAAAAAVVVGVGCSAPPEVAQRVTAAPTSPRPTRPSTSTGTRSRLWVIGSSMGPVVMSRC